ncbi:hypothetical protein CYMTET_48499 [Cymbomonas tetramitiformis]|uniref:Uncharacterized protein n=1 Tax=Cymbomonas tetramitiformis TaxID=36881 RepID=A0AAE0EWQ9_9CHLO|nr:hypothetical protein CYMTET_48499 [Cymbomonas tetramitiformis]
MGTHEPYMEQPRPNSYPKIHTPLNKENRGILQDTLLRTHDWTKTTELGGLTLTAKLAREEGDTQMARIAINRAGEMVQDILTQANKEAPKNAQFPKEVVNSASSSRETELLMKRQHRNKRNEAITKMRKAKKTKRQLRDAE